MAECLMCGLQSFNAKERLPLALRDNAARDCCVFKILAFIVDTKFITKSLSLAQ
jgi:hypothetical protein